LQLLRDFARRSLPRHLTPAHVWEIVINRRRSFAQTGFPNYVWGEVDLGTEIVWDGSRKHVHSIFEEVRYNFSDDAPLFGKYYPDDDIERWQLLQEMRLGAGAKFVIRLDGRWYSSVDHYSGGVEHELDYDVGVFVIDHGDPGLLAAMLLAWMPKYEPSGLCMPIKQFRRLEMLSGLLS